jgi:malic enzyme
MSSAMKLAAARALAEAGGDGDEPLPDPLDPSVHERVAAAVREAAERSG